MLNSSLIQNFRVLLALSNDETDALCELIFPADGALYETIFCSANNITHT